MATANGADFSTQAYRHGVLIGNWNEDQYGCDVLMSSPSALTSQPAVGYCPQTTTHSTFTTAGHDIIRNSVYEEKAKARYSSEVDKSLLFPHRGAAPIDQRYATSYLTSYTGGGPPSQPPVTRSIEKITAHANGSEEGLREQSRFRTYRTASTDAFNVQNSILAISADERATQMKQSSGALRATQLSQSLEANYRKLRLRKD